MRLTMMRGLPASGKTTEAMKLVKEGWKRVNRDELRQMIDGGKYSKENEETIKRMEYELATNLLRMGFNVVVDDTNMKPADRFYWNAIAEMEGAGFYVQVLGTLPEVCVERDAQREHTVGAEVIWNMYRQSAGDDQIWDPRRRFA